MSLNVEMNRMLAQMKAMEQVASLDRVQPNNLAGSAVTPSEPNAQPSFGSLFKDAVDQVNGLHKDAGALREGYLAGDSGIDITRVMVANQKSSIASQAMIQVRNKLVESYKEVMNMPV